MSCNATWTPIADKSNVWSKFEYGVGGSSVTVWDNTNTVWDAGSTVWDYKSGDEWVNPCQV